METFFSYFTCVDSEEQAFPGQPRSQSDKSFSFTIKQSQRRSLVRLKESSTKNRRKNLCVICLRVAANAIRLTLARRHKHGHSIKTTTRASDIKKNIVKWQLSDVSIYLHKAMIEGAGVSGDFTGGLLSFKFMHLQCFPSFFSAVSPHPEATADRM